MDSNFVGINATNLGTRTIAGHCNTGIGIQKLTKETSAPPKKALYPDQQFLTIFVAVVPFEDLIKPWRQCACTYIPRSLQMISASTPSWGANH